MPGKPIRDKNYRLLGYEIEKKDGKTELRDAAYRKLGTYDPKTNQTRDGNHGLVGWGDSLKSLLRRK